MYKVLITTVPFGSKNSRPIDLLEEAGIDYLINPLNKKLTEDELCELVGDFDIIIAGTEPITPKVIDAGKNLKMISRVGVGLDSVNLIAARQRGIVVSYTPDAPAPAVAELTLALMLNQLRMVSAVDREMRSGKWIRMFGRRLSEITVGLIGVGRIGSTVLRHLHGFGVRSVLVNDVRPSPALDQKFNLKWVAKEEIYRNADVISVHVPLNRTTKNMIRKEQLLSMRKDAILVNTARGGIVNESDLFEVMKTGHLGGAAIDVFDQEPYFGPLTAISRCLLTAHMGSMSVDCRARMEIEATEEAIRFARKQPLEGLIPSSEYDLHEKRV